MSSKALYSRALAARQQDARLLIPRLMHVLKDMREDPDIQLAAQDLGTIRHLLRDLRQFPELHELLASFRELALSIFDVRINAAEAFTKLHPSVPQRAVDIGIIKSRAKLLTQMLDEAIAFEAQQAREQQAAEADDEANVVPPGRSAEAREASRSSQDGRQPSRQVRSSVAPPTSNQQAKPAPVDPNIAHQAGLAPMWPNQIGGPGFLDPKTATRAELEAFDKAQAIVAKALAPTAK